MSNGLYLTIGGVTLSGLEIPQELSPVGTRQSLVKHEFPGGVITIQPLGAFPDGPITWSGILTGTDAFGRSQKLQRLAATGDTVTLSYGPFAWTGVVSMYAAKPQHQWLVPYQITFEPIEDLSGVTTVPFSLEDAETILGTQVSAVTSLIDGDDGLSLPATVGAFATTMLSTVSQALLNGNGTVAGIDAEDATAITLTTTAVIDACLPYSLGADPTTSSPCLDMSVRATAINQIVGNPASGQRLVRAVNPNLFAVAQQYLGDASLWQDIATASGLPPDPQPIGTFTLTVPA